MASSAASVINLPANPASSSPPRKPWERYIRETGQRESDKAFRAFQLYLTFGEQRTQEKVASELGVSKQLINRWCFTWHWIVRAQAYEDEEARQLLEMLSKRRAKARARHADIGRVMQAKGIESINALATQLANGVLTPAMTASVAARLIDIGTKLERLAMGNDESETPTMITVNIGARKPRTPEEAALAERLK